MAYSNIVKILLMASIRELSQKPENYARHPGKDFTRYRKIGFEDLILLLITMEGDCLKEELYRFFDRKNTAPKKSAFYHQRAKLKEDTLQQLLRLFCRKFKPSLFRNRYRLVACDGSSVDIFRDASQKDTYFAPNGKSPRGFNQIHINALYSILDKQFLDVLVQPARKRNEYMAFCSMVDRADDEFAVIYIADRGYASYNDFAHVIEKKQHFLIRCTDAKTEKILGRSLDGVREVDWRVDRILCRSTSKKKYRHPERLDDYRYVCPAVPMDFISKSQPEYSISLRVVRIEIAPGEYENLITNLPEDEFDFGDFKDLYHLRWSQETAYRDMKYPLCLKAFHSKKYEYIVQEVFARAIMYNYSTVIAMNTKVPDSKRKLKYQVNFAEAIKICRDDLRNRSGDKAIDVESLIADNIEAIRPNRTFRRQARFKLPMSFCYRS